MGKRFVLLTVKGLFAREEAARVIAKCKKNIDVMLNEFEGIDQCETAKMRPAGESFDNDIIVDLVNMGGPIVVVETDNDVYYSIPKSLKLTAEKAMSQVH